MFKTFYRLPKKNKKDLMKVAKDKKRNNKKNLFFQ